MGILTNERKAEIKASVKAICQKYGVKATISVERGYTPVLNVNVSAGKIDFLGSYNRIMSDRPNLTNWSPATAYVQANPYWFHEAFDGEALDFLTEIYQAINVGNHDNSDSQSDYFDVGWYDYVNIGKWEKPYQLTF